MSPLKAEDGFQAQFAQLYVLDLSMKTTVGIVNIYLLLTIKLIKLSDVTTANLLRKFFFCSLNFSVFSEGGGQLSLWAPTRSRRLSFEEI